MMTSPTHPHATFSPLEDSRQGMTNVFDDGGYVGCCLRGRRLVHRREAALARGVRNLKVDKEKSLILQNVSSNDLEKPLLCDTLDHTESLFGSIVFLGKVNLSTPVVLGLGHVVSLGDRLNPRLAEVSSTLGVPVSVVGELAGLGNILLVTGLLGGVSLGADSLVLGLGESRWDVGALSDLSGLEALLGALSVLVLVLLRGVQIHVEHSVEESVELGGTRAGRSRGKCRSGGNKGKEKGDELHVVRVLNKIATRKL